MNGRQARVPIAPLITSLVRRGVIEPDHSHADIARAIGFSAWVIGRAIRDGELTVYAADRAAWQGLGVHPTAIWGDTWLNQEWLNHPTVERVRPHRPRHPTTTRGGTDVTHQYLSVTSILNSLDKPALVPWAAYRVADEICKEPDYWAGEVKRSPQEARNRLAGSRYRPEGAGQLSATELGTQLHRACEHWAIQGVRPQVVHPEVEPLLGHVGDLLDLYQPEIVASEIVVVHRGYGYAGQCDGIWKIGGATYLIDFKSSAKTHNGDGTERSPYPEVSLQTTAYSRAELVIPWRDHTRERRKSGRWYEIPDEGMARAVPMPAVDGTLAVLVTPGFAHPHQLLAGEEEWLTFLHLLEVSRWQNGRGKNAVGPLLAPPGRSDVRLPQDAA